MKNFSAFFLSMVISTGVFAQADLKSEIEQIKSIWGKELKSLTNEALSLSTAEADKFWPLWEAYRAERSKLGDARTALIKSYAESYSTMTDQKAAELTKGGLKNEAALTKLKAKYLKKISKAVSPIRAAQFLQLESYIDNQLRAAISQSLPFIPDPVK